MTISVSTTSPGSARRDATVDIAKGLAIIMIVIGHVLRGLSASGQLDPATAAYRATDTALYSVHLATFVLLAGLFVQRGVARAGARPYLLGRAADFLYLYLLWTLIQGLVKVATSSLVNKPMTPWGLVEAIWKPEGQLWFFPFLLITTVVVALIAPWRNRSLTVTTVLLVSVVALLTWGTQGSYIGQAGWSLVVFFVIGAVAGHQALSRAIDRLPGLPTVLLGGVAFAGLVALEPAAPTSSAYPLTARAIALGVVATLIGLTVLLAVSKQLGRTPVGAPLSFVGRHSMEIFLAHIIAASGSRIVLTQLGIDDPGVLIGVGVVAGVAAPLVLWWAAQRLPLGWLFTRPRQSVKAS